MNTQSILNQEFDKVFVLSLEKERDKRANISTVLGDLNIEFEFFDAVNGYDIKYNVEWEFYSKRPLSTYYEKTYNKKFIESRGAWGCLKSYYEIFKLAIKKKYKRILILEDDVLFCENFEEKVKEFFVNIPDPNWKMVLLGCSQHFFEEHMDENYYRPVKFRTTGAFANGYDESVYKEIMKDISLMETAFDNTPIGHIFESYPEECFVAFPNLIIADVRSSNIREGRNLDKFAEKMQWDLSLFKIEDQ